MNFRDLFLKVFLLLCVAQFAHADIVTKILQNGLDGYSGCEDTYIRVQKGISGDTADYLYWHDNFSSDPIVILAN
jgi:hypothetical protein